MKKILKENIRILSNCNCMSCSFLDLNHGDFRNIFLGKCLFDNKSIYDSCLCDKYLKK